MARSNCELVPLGRAGRRAETASLGGKGETNHDVGGKREKGGGFFFLFAKTSMGNTEHMAGERRGGAGPAAAPPAVALGPMCAARCAAAALPRRGQGRRSRKAIAGPGRELAFVASSRAPRYGRSPLASAQDGAGGPAGRRSADKMVLSGRGLLPRPDGSSGSGAKRRPWRSALRPGPLRCPRARRAGVRFVRGGPPAAGPSPTSPPQHGPERRPQPVQAGPTQLGASRAALGAPPEACTDTSGSRWARPGPAALPCPLAWSGEASAPAPDT